VRRLYLGTPYPLRYQGWQIRRNRDFVECLESNPVSEAADVEFWTTEVLRVRELYKTMLEEKERQQEQESSVIATNASKGSVGGSA
jgi:hypothetical protein